MPEVRQRLVDDLFRALAADPLLDREGRLGDPLLPAQPEVADDQPPLALGKRGHGRSERGGYLMGDQRLLGARCRIRDIEPDVVIEEGGA